MTTRGLATSATGRALMRITTGFAPNLRSFGWAVRQLRSVHRRLPIEGTETRIRRPVRPGPHGWWGVRLAIFVVNPTCLERSLLLQSWMGAYGDAPDVVIGVRSGSNGVEAHAWIEHRDPWFDPTYSELTRLAP